MEKKVRIYSTPTCPYCIRAKAFLTEHGIPFEDINVAADATARQEMMSKTGQMGVPVIQIGETIIVGFDRSAIARALGIE